MDRFPYAAGYYPIMHSKADWEKDLNTMNKCHINVIRTAELFNTWDQIEPERGKFNFGFLDDFFDKCQKKGIKILLGTGTASPPYWLHEMDPHMNILSNTGKRYPNNVSYSWACFHNPTYLRESERYIRTLVERYKNHQALYAYQIHNEIGFPFMPLDGNGVDLYCYCDHTKGAFREWLKNKYKTLDELNHAWTWSATNVRHVSWDMVEPPYAKPTSWSSVTRWMDFRLFLMDTITNFVKWQNDLIKEMDQDHPTSTNIFYMKGQDKMAVLTAIDQFEIAKAVDVIGYDLYPGSGNKLEKAPEFSSMFLDHGRSISKPLNKDYWLMEVESGPINGWALGPNRNTDQWDIERYIYEALAHDAKMTLYQGFRQWDFQPLQWGGLVDLYGNETQRTDGAANAGKFIQDNDAYLLNATTKKGEIAILTSKENAIIANGMGHEDFLVKALRGSYRVLWEKGYHIDLITPEHFKTGYAMDYKAIIMPFMIVIDRELADNIAEYTRSGGIIIGNARTGYVNERGWYNHTLPCHSLQSVFGIDVEEVESNIQSKITFNKGNYDGYWHKEKIKVLEESTKVMARFFDDTPAVTLNTFGNGLALYFATHPDVAYLENQSHILWDVLDEVLAMKNIKPRLTIDYSNRLDKEIDGHLLFGDEQNMLIITHYIKRGRADLFISGKKLIKVTMEAEEAIDRIYDYRTQEEIKFNRIDDRIQFEVSLEKNKTAIYVLVKEVTK